MKLAGILGGGTPAPPQAPHLTLPQGSNCPPPHALHAKPIRWWGEVAHRFCDKTKEIAHDNIGVS